MGKEERARVCIFIRVSNPSFIDLTSDREREGEEKRRVNRHQLNK